MNATIEEIYRSGFVRDAEGKPYKNAPTSIPYETGVHLYECVRAGRPALTLEVGMAYGLSTLFIAQALKDNGVGRHIAIDPYEESEFRSIGLLNLARAGLSDLVTFHSSPGELVLPRLAEEGVEVDFAFIDGSHLFDFILVDFFYVDRLLRVGGQMALDDLWMPAVRKAATFILNNRSYTLTRPAARSRLPSAKMALKIARRIVQNPLERDWRIKLQPAGVVIFTKTAGDVRPWRFYRNF